MKKKSIEFIFTNNLINFRYVLSFYVFTYDEMNPTSTTIKLSHININEVNSTTAITTPSTTPSSRQSMSQSSSQSTTQDTTQSTITTKIDELTTTIPTITTTEDIFSKYDYVDVVKNLMFCAYYNFTLYSEGFNGLGSSEVISTFSKTENTESMTPPTVVTIQDIRENSMRVSWFPPEGNSLLCLTKYEVQWVNLDEQTDTGSVEVDREQNEKILSK